MATIEVITGAVIDTRYEITGGKDVAVTVVVDGVSYEGAVSLVECGRGYAAYGGTSAEYWISGQLITDLEGALAPDERLAAYNKIESAAAKACVA